MFLSIRVAAATGHSCFSQTPRVNASDMSWHGSVAPKYNGRSGLRPTREEARRLRAKIEYACC